MNPLCMQCTRNYNTSIKMNEIKYTIKLCTLCLLNEYNKCYCNIYHNCINCNIKHSKHEFDIIKYNSINYFLL